MNSGVNRTQQGQVAPLLPAVFPASSAPGLPGLLTKGRADHAGSATVLGKEHQVALVTDFTGPGENPSQGTVTFHAKTPQVTG